MPRSRRGFQLQQFLSGNIVPSTASKPTGVVPESPLSLGSMKNPAFSAGALGGTPAQQLQSGAAKLNLAGGQMLIPQASAIASPTKFADFQKELSGISLGKNLMTQQSVLGSSLLGTDATGTDWAKIFGYQGAGSDLISAALKKYGISKPAGGLGAVNSFSPDWLKSMGLV